MAVKFNPAFLACAIYATGFLSPLGALGAQDESWTQRFTPGSPPPEYNTPRDQDRYFGQLCQDVILPQWQSAPDPQSAITQMESLMGQIKARFVSQEDISRGYAVYYYNTNKPVHESLTQPGAAFSYLVKDNPHSIPHPDLRESALYYKNTYNIDPTGMEIYTTPDNLTQVMLPIYSVKGLQKFWETKELQNPPSFIPKIFQTTQMGFPQEWIYNASERRDFFTYHYSYDFPDQSSETQRHGRIILKFDGERTESGTLEDIVLRDVSCRSEKDIFLEETRLRTPIIMQDCRAYKDWYACYFNPKGSVNKKLCARYPKEEPSCEAEN